jgi:CubicO group peptidase (beta-lactamase class C family)
MRKATTIKGLLLAAVVLGLANTAHADDSFCFDQYFVYATEILPTLEKAVGSVVVTYKLGEKKPCFFPLGQTAQTKGVPIDANTVFELASVTKVFTTGILGMHTEFPLALDVNSAVKQYLPPAYDLTKAEEGVTFQQLATFTGGFFWSDPPGFKKGVSTQQDFEDAVNGLDPTDAPNGQGPIPGEKDLPTLQFYSNSSVGFLGQILMDMDSIATGVSYSFDAKGFSSWISDNLTVPLEMPNTKVHPGGTLATGYKFIPGKKGAPDTYDPKPPYPWVPWGAAGALRSTANDMATFLKANICAHYISDKACAEFPESILNGLAAAHNPNDYVPAGKLTDPVIQLGVCGSQKEQAWAWIYVAPPADNPGVHPIVFKGGDHPSSGFGAFIGISPYKKYGVVILTNTQPLGIDPIGLNMIQNTP